MDVTEHLQKKYEALIGIARRKFPQIYEKAYEIFARGGVREYIFKSFNIRIWVVTGRRSLYLVVQRNEKFICSCPDFVFHVLLKASEIRRTFCAHILACILCILHKRNVSYEIENNDFLFSHFIAKWI